MLIPQVHVHVKGGKILSEWYQTQFCQTGSVINIGNHKRVLIEDGVADVSKGKRGAVSADLQAFSARRNGRMSRFHVRPPLTVKGVI